MIPGFSAQQANMNAGEPLPTHLVIFAGQSNQRAYETTGSDVPVDLQGTVSGIRIWNSHTATLELYEAGVNSDAATSGATTPQKWGPEAAFAKDFRTANPTTPLVIVKLAVDGTQLASGGGDDWSDSSTGELFDDVSALVAAATGALAAESVTIDGTSILWMQGETDAEDTTKATNYGVNLTAFVAAARSDWGDASSKFILGRITPASAKSFASTVRAFQTKVADESSDTHAIDMDFYALAGDGYHLAVSGVRSLGEDMFSAWAGTYSESLPIRFGPHTSDKNASVSLTNGNLTAEGGGTSPSAFQLARCDKSPRGGKFYVEFEIDQQTANLNIGAGYAVATNSWFGQAAQSIGYARDGNVFKNAANIGTYASYTAGDIVMMAFDGATGRLWFGKNGTWNGDPAAGTGFAGTITVPTTTALPRVGATLRRSGDKVTVLPQAADWTYSPPSGFGPL